LKGGVFLLKVKPLGWLWGMTVAVLVTGGHVGAEEESNGRAVQTALVQLTHAEARIRVQAIRMLGAIRDPQVVPFLQQAIHDPDPSVQAAARQALKKLEVKDAPLLRKRQKP